MAPCQRILAAFSFGFLALVAATGSILAASPTLTTLISFNRTNGAEPVAGLIADAGGDLFGTTVAGGVYGDGTVFEIPKAGTNYAAAPTTLVSFYHVSTGAAPEAPLISNAAGNLFGTTALGGTNGYGTVFQVTRTAGGYASTPITLVSFNGFFNGSNGAQPLAGLIADAAGNLFGATEISVFELTNHNGGYTLTTLAEPTGDIEGGVIADAAGDLFGTTSTGGADGEGTVFELVKTGGSYTLTTLATFNGTNGTDPRAGLVADAAGNLFGTTFNGGTNNDGTVFELVNDHGSYSFTTLLSFNGTNGEGPWTSLVADAAGNLFGTTFNGGTNDAGTVFELVNTHGSYSFTTLLNFNGTNGEGPQAGLFFDAAGNLYGTTYGGGAYDAGTVFELSRAGTPLSENPQTSDFNAAGKSDILWQNSDGQAAVWLMNGATPTAEASVGANPGTSWHVVGAGDFYGSLYSDILWQNTDGAVSIWEMNGTTVVATGSPGNPGPSWHAVGTGDFNGDGYSDILWQNTNGAVAIWEMNGLKVIGSATVGNPGTSWHVIGSGDFNGDGYSDILWQNTNGAVAIWEMNGLKVVGSAVVGNPGASWHAIGSGDFYGNGYSDILWQNTNGAVAIWEMDGLKVIGSAVIGNPGTSWHVVDSGDFYGNGFSDILWQSANGEVDIWEMDGAKVIDTGSPGNPGASWLTIGECPATRLAPCTR
jgi:uncharacterized repeat protein (TIGR03803 family)